QPPRQASRNSSKGVPLMPYDGLSMTASNPPSPLVEAFEHQDKIFASVFSILQQGIAQHAFPAASVAVTHRGRLVALKTLGAFTYEPNSPTVTPSTLFDLASLTKVV